MAAERDWSHLEVEAIVADYLNMLALELAGQVYSKAARRRQLMTKLSGRSEGSIEFKHANISAALIELGYPYISGYKPRSNFQQLVLEVLAAQLSTRRDIDALALDAIARPAVTAPLEDFSDVLRDPPRAEYPHQVREPRPEYAVKRDYLQRESQNASLGLAGEEYVMRFESWRLWKAGAKQLADRVEHIAQTRGDGLGYDVLSFEPDGREKLIEVKTTTFGALTPFYVSANEVRVSEARQEDFHLYRVFEFRKKPQVFDLPGPIAKHVALDPVSFVARFG